jgi:MarR family transcriptional regulator, organic hydroperoxide resistance regulator
MEFENTVSFILAKLSVAHRNLVERTARRAGLHGGQIFVLLELWKQDGQRQIDLAQKLALSPPTVNKTLGGLLGNDFVTRERYEDDARSTRIFLTDKGREVRSQLEMEWELLEARTLSGLTDTESLMLKQLLTKLVIDLI